MDVQSLRQAGNQSKIWLGGLLGILFLGHLLLLWMGSFERSADGWIHLFFADHWQHSWWNDWEPRWNGGFSLFSYPPLAHQLMALTGWLLGWPLAAECLLLVFLAVLLWGVYRLSCCWFDANTARLAVLLVASMSSLAMVLHDFGQLPNLLALALLLHALTYTWHWLLEGSKRDLAPALLLALASALCNLYAGVFGFLMFGLPILLEAWSQNRLVTSKRSGVMLVIGLPLALLLLAPALYFQAVYQADAVAVFHSSRANVLALQPFNWFMFYGQYAAYLLAVPFWLVTSWKDSSLRRFAPSLVLLTVLSLGGATPLAHGLLGKLFDSLTFDRFGQWNSLLLTPLLAAWALKQWEKKCWRPVLALLALLHLAAGVYSATGAWWRPLPALRDLTPLVNFLRQPQTQPYRYLTLGLGRTNFAKLSTLVPNQSIDGNFPFGRNQALMNGSGIASLDDARYYGPQGYAVLEPLLQQAPQQHLKYILLADPSYVPLLQQSGWQRQEQIQDVGIWEQDGVPPLADEVRTPSPLFLRLIWGIAPLLVLILGVWMAWWAEKRPLLR